MIPRCSVNWVLTCLSRFWLVEDYTLGYMRGCSCWSFSVSVKIYFGVYFVKISDCSSSKKYARHCGCCRSMIP